MDPSDAEIAQFELTSNVDKIATWLDFCGQPLKSLVAALDLDPDLSSVHPRMLAIFSEEEFNVILKGLVVDGAAPTMGVQAKAKLLHRTARFVLRAGLPPAPAAQSQALALGPGPSDLAVAVAAAVAAAQASVGHGRKVKMANVIDPGDESEVAQLAPDEERVFYDNYFQLKQGPPDD